MITGYLTLFQIKLSIDYLTHYAFMGGPAMGPAETGGGSSDSNAGSSCETITIPYTTQHDTGLSGWWHHFHPFGGHQPIKGGFFHRYNGHNDPYTEQHIPWWDLPRW
jgi:hypothetical protein